MNYVVLGQNIKKYRKERNLTQEALSERVGIGPVFMSQIENASRKPSLETVVHIAAALNVSIDILVNGSNRKDIELNKYIDTELTREQLNIISFAFKNRTQEEVRALIKAFTFLLDF